MMERLRVPFGPEAIDWLNAWLMNRLGVPSAFHDLDLDCRIRGLEANYDHADLRQFARAALTVEPEPSSYEIKHGAIPA